MFEKTKAFCDSFLELGVPGFDLAVYRDGKPILRYMNGYSDLENKVPMRGDERYNIYSCSKVITCTAAMQLWERGLFSLEDELSRYMPEFAEMTVKRDGVACRAEKPILIKHLFEMTAGFDYNCKSPEILEACKATEGRCPTREVMRYLAKRPLSFEPGERWEYSLCHDVLAGLVEVLSGEKFEDYVKKNIFDVAGMTRTTFMLPEDGLWELAEQYRFEGGRANNVGKQIVGYKFGREYASGGAGCISTVDDYIKFLEALRIYKLLKPETLALMTTDRLNDQQSKTYWRSDYHGYGLGVRCHKAGGVMNDFGWGGAACAYLAVDMEMGVSLYFGAHLLSSPAQGIRNMLYHIVRAELSGEGDFDRINEDLKRLYNYDLTY